MKIKVVDNRLFIAFLKDEKGSQKLEVTQKDNGRAPVILGPQEYVPGMEPRNGVTASQFVRCQMSETFPLKPAAAKALKKFIEEPKPQPKVLGPDILGKIGYMTMELHEATETLDMVMNSHMMDATGGGAEEFEKIRVVLNHLVPVIVNKTRELYKFSDEHPVDADV